MSYPIPENMLNTMASQTVVTTPNATNVTYAAS